MLAAVDGSLIEVSSGQGEIATGTRQITLTDLVRLSTSNGYTMETAGVVANLETGRLASLGPLEARAPFGTLTAGQVTVSTSQDGTGQQMVFNGGVTLLYQPQP